MEQTIIRLIDFESYNFEGVTIKDSNDDYNVYINSRLSADKQKAALEHELEHIRRGHFWDEIRTVKELEKDLEMGTADQRPAR